MEPSLFAFIWRYSRPQQIGLLLFTLASFPFLYATLELPKRIVNDAIGAPVSVIDVLGWQLHPEQYLLVLCFRVPGRGAGLWPDENAAQYAEGDSV